MNVEEFWASVDSSGGPDACWPWLRGCSRRGYGVVSFNGKIQKASRVACELAHGPLGELHALHTCDNPPCCNPRHLYGGTNAKNMEDKVARGRHYKGPNHHWAKITERQKTLIISLIGCAPQSSIAALFGIRRSYVRRIHKEHLN